MLALLRLFGVDLERRLHFLRSWTSEFARLNAENVRDEARRLALSAALAAAGGLMALAMFAVLLIALYAFLAEHYGPGIGYGAVAGILALASVTLLLLASWKSNSRSELALEYPPAQAYPDEAPTRDREPATERRQFSSAQSMGLTFGDWKRPLSGALSEAYGVLPQTGTPVDKVIDEVLQHASRSADRTVDAAADMVRTGSRKTVVSVLAGAALLGYVLARAHRNPPPDREATM